MSLAIGIALLVLALLGTPLFAVIGASALLAFYRADTPLAVVADNIYRLAEMPVLLAIPLFTFAGYLLGESRTPTRLVRLTNAAMGRVPGGLAMVALVICALFTAFTGASGVTIVALGALLYPALLQAGYQERFTLGLITTSGSLGLLFAPSLPLILYGVVAQQLPAAGAVSIDALFLAGILPGVLMLVLLAGFSMWRGRGLAMTEEPASWSELAGAIRDAGWELPLPVLVLGGIYTGFFAVSEAAAVTALYVLVVEVGIRREIPWRELPRIMREAMVMVGAIMVILGVSLASTNYLIQIGAAQSIFEATRGFIDSGPTFLAVLIPFLLLLGMMLDIFSALVLVVPLILPLGIKHGVDPIHLGIVFLATMQLGYFTPPVGMNLFIASHRFNRPVMELYRSTIPFFLILLGAVLLIAFWPPLSLFLATR